MPLVDPNKTVFISYRPNVSQYIARAIFLALRQQGYDVFFDSDGIGSGDFERIILNQIAARTHFILILTVGTLDRVVEPGDWLRREIEYALELKRNIIPLVVDDFSLKEESRFLTGKLKTLLEYNALPVHYEYFDESMVRLQKSFLSVDVAEHKIVPPPKDTTLVVEQRIEAALKQPEPTSQELTAEAYFSRGLSRLLEQRDAKGLRDLYQAIQLDPKYVVQQIDKFTATPPNTKHIFLSYSRNDATMMKRVHDTLTDNQFSVWIDEGIEPGTPSWKRAIQEAIESSGCMIVILSPSAKASKWVEQELDYAETHKKKVFPLLAKGDEKTAILFGYTLAQWIDIREENLFSPNMAKLIPTIRNHLTT